MNSWDLTNENCCLWNLWDLYTAINLLWKNPLKIRMHQTWARKGRSSPQQRHGLWLTYSFPYNVGKPIINHPSNHHMCGINNSHMTGGLLSIILACINHIITQSYDHCALIGCTCSCIGGLIP